MYIGQVHNVDNLDYVTFFMIVSHNPTFCMLVYITLKGVPSSSFQKVSEPNVMLICTSYEVVGIVVSILK